MFSAYRFLYWEGVILCLFLKARMKFSGFSYPIILLIWLTVSVEFFRSRSAFWKRICFNSWEKVQPKSFLIYREQ